MWLLPPLLLVLVPGCRSSIYGPSSVSGSRGGSLTIQCDYDRGWETYRKWWCRGEGWASCEILIQTSGAEEKVQRGRMSIQDDHRGCRFAVTIEELRGGDEGFHWCGIEKSGTDLGHQVYVFVGPAKPVTTQPTVPETTPPAVSFTSLAPTSLASSPLIAQSSNSSLALTGLLAGALCCHIQVILLTFVKALLLAGLLCALMCRRRHPGDSKEQ